MVIDGAYPTEAALPLAPFRDSLRKRLYPYPSVKQFRRAQRIQGHSVDNEVSAWA